FHQSLIPGSVAGLKIPIRGICPDALLFILPPRGHGPSPAKRKPPIQKSKMENHPNNITSEGSFHEHGCGGDMSALGQKQTCASQKAMSALPPIATAKADFRKRSCLLYPQKRSCAVQWSMSALGQKRTSWHLLNRLSGGREKRRRDRLNPRPRCLLG